MTEPEKTTYDLYALQTESDDLPGYLMDSIQSWVKTKPNKLNIIELSEQELVEFAEVVLSTIEDFSGE
jgi:hypothetical protein